MANNLLASCFLISYYDPYSLLNFIMNELYLGSVTITTDPVGIPVDGESNTFDYPILSSVTLMCEVYGILGNGSLAADAVTSYQWNATNCYNNSHGVDHPCFYGGGKTDQIINGKNLQAQDAGTVSCTATIDGANYISEPLTLRISGELIAYTFSM